MAVTPSYIGVLALQGAFREHVTCLRQVGIEGMTVKEVRTHQELDRCDALVVPGGESTVMRIASGAEGGKLMEALRHFVHVEKKPVWGTCAGCILLSDEVVGSEDSYGDFIQGLPIRTARNFFGTQVESFERAVTLDPCISGDGPKEYMAICIRAPSIMAVHDKDVKILAQLQYEDKNVPAGVRFGNLMGTIFHPELTGDLRFHHYFVHQMVLPSLSILQARVGVPRTTHR